MRKQARREDFKITVYSFGFNFVSILFCFFWGVFYVEPWNVCLLNFFDAVLLCLSVLTWTSRNLQKQTEYELSFIVLIQIIERHFVIH